MSKNHAYAYEAGYRDGSVHYELEHCPACKNVADLQEALEENATLRQQLADVTESMGRVEAQNAKLREDRDRYKVMFESVHATAGELHRVRHEWKRDREQNAKLRELVRDVNRAAHMLCEAWEGSCSKEAEGMSLHAVCPISDTNDLCVFGKLYDRMRELGVEVE